MCSYRPAVPVDFVMQELAFESSSKGLEFLNRFPLSYTDVSKLQIDCKASGPAMGNA